MNNQEPAACLIRQATLSDVPLLHRYILKLAEYERLLDKVVMTPGLLEEHLFGARPSAEAVLAFEGEACIGFALFFHNFSTFAGRPGLYLEDIFIDPEYRGKGYGRQLLAYLAKVARQRGCARMEWSVLKWNQPAIDFYLSLGARPMDEWSVFRMEEGAISALASTF